MADITESNNGEDQTQQPPGLLTSGIQPREYQLSLFKRALSDNTVVILETGSGKTLVAVMLIQWFAQRDASLAKHRDSDSSSAPTASGDKKKPRKVRVFLNNTVALVHQQARVIAGNTDQKVQEFVGSMGIDGWDALKWADTWNSATVLVMTHQVLLNALRAGYVHITDIDLLVFDECHHARGHHPYALIMREFYDCCPEADRPHIFGMTASPLNARQTAQASVMHLQSALDSNICTVDLTVHADDALLSKQTSLCYEYALPPEYESTHFTRTLAEKCGASKVIADGLRAMPVVLSLLGPFGVDQMWHYKIILWYRRMMHYIPTRSLRPSAARNSMLASLAPDGSVDPGSEDLTSEITKESSEQPSQASHAPLNPFLEAILLKRAIEIDREYGGGTSFNPAEALPPMLSDEKPSPIPHLHSSRTARRPWDVVRKDLSPQVNRLLGILYEWRSRPDELRGIVFAHRRLTAVLLVYIISHIAEFSFITTDVLLGVAQKSGASMDRPIREGSMRAASNLTLNDFAAGKINLIFATQVAEEGVDIQPCNLVIRFDLPQTATSLIQSRGRARMANSQFIVMVPEVDDIQKEMMSNDGMVVAEAELQNGDSMVVDVKGSSAADTASVDPNELGSIGDPKAPLSEHRASYTDYLKLVSLEECLRDWCKTESMTINEQPGDGIIVTDRSRIDYGMLLRRLSQSLVIDDSTDTGLEEIWIEQKDRSGRIYTIVTTQARITYLSAVNIVYQYVQLLPQEASFSLAPVFEFACETQLEEQNPQDVERSSEPPLDGDAVAIIADVDFWEPASNKKKKKKKAPKPIQTTVYRCTVTLPANSAIRQVVGPLMPNKKLAKQAAAYRTAKKLHQLGAIDDNLCPVVEVADDSNKGRGVGNNDTLNNTNVKNQGTKASVAKYECAVPSVFVHPPLDDLETEMLDFDNHDEPEEGLIEPEPEYHPRPWHLYRFSLQHVFSTNASSLILATARPLPSDTLVPLYLSQYAKEQEEMNSSPTFIGFDYIGSQVLDKDQLEILASFSSNLMVRVIFAEMSWVTPEIGVVVAPVLFDGSGIDFGYAKSCFADRSGIYKQHSDSDYTQLIGRPVMDGLDNGRLKLVVEVCDDVDIHSDLAQYHARRKGVVIADSQCTNSSTQSPASIRDSQLSLAATLQDGAVTHLHSSPSAFSIAETPSSAPCSSPAKDSDGSDAVMFKRLKNGKKGESLRAVTRTMVEWAHVKHIVRLIPKGDMGNNVPLFKVKDVGLTNNYMVAQTTHLASDDENMLNSHLQAETEMDVDSKSQTCAYPDVIYSSPFFCANEPMSLDELNNLSLLPAFLLRLEQVLIADEVKKTLGLSVKTETARQALTASSSCMDVCYERLETLGDSVLKYITSIALYVSHPDDHEGLLTSRRSAIVGNHNLFKLSLERNLEKSIIASMFVKREFRYPGSGWERFTSIHRKLICMRAFDIEANDTPSASSSSSNVAGIEQNESATDCSLQNSNPKPAPKRQTRKINTSRLLSEKTIADVVESLLGACIIDGGFEGALMGARALGVVQTTWSSWSQFARIWELSIAARKSSMQQLDFLCSKAIASVGGTEEIIEMFEELKLDKEDVLYGRSMVTDDIVLTEMASRQYQKQNVGTKKGSWVSNIEEALGYVFKDRSILIEALTHCSSVDLLSSSYQRLEFLGDAILDYFVTRRYYDYKPELSPHRITLVKHIAVSNNLFAVILVCHGLHKYIRHDSGILAEAIKDYIQRLTNARSTWARNNSGGGDAINKLKESGSETSQQDAVVTSSYDDENGEKVDSFKISSARSMLPVWVEDLESRPTKCRKPNGVGSEQSGLPSDTYAYDGEADIFHNLPPECWNLVEPPK
ncbi:Dicer-like protein 1, partial [Coemansia sp. RSA 1804]